MALLNKVAPNVLRDYWNNKWDKRNIIVYTGRGVTYVTKIFEETKARSQFNEKTKAYEQAVKEVREAVKGKDLDSTFYYIVDWVREKIKYQSDQYTYSKPEYWATPGETLLKGVGDCEDGAILIVALSRDVGIPAYRVKLCAGFVREPRTGKEVGHAYAIFLREKYNEWFVGDWCYYPELSKYRYKKGVPHRSCPEYFDIWWTSNWKYSWKQKSTRW